MMKFGGTSVDGAEGVSRISRLVERFRREGHQIVVVTSAMANVTDTLIKMADMASGGRFPEKLLESLRNKHLKALKAVSEESLREEVQDYISSLLDELGGFLSALSVVGEVSPRMLDYVLSFGERLSTKIVWAKLRDMGMEAEYFTGWDAGIVTDDSFGSARPLMEETRSRVRERLLPLLEKGVIPVVTGYIAATREGHVTTFGRGGSNLTATLLGACLDADEVWIWTDVDGVMTADPKIVDNARTVPYMSYDEAAEIAFFGAKVIQPYMVAPAMEAGVPIRVRNTFNPSCEGTLIGGDCRPTEQTVKVVCMKEDVAMVSLKRAYYSSARDMVRLMEAFLEVGVEGILMSQSFPKGGLCVIVPKSKLRQMLKSLKDVEDLTVEVEEDVSLIAVVGAGMKGRPGIAARTFGAVAKRGINVRAIVQGPSEFNISFIVKSSDGREAVRAVHEEFIG